MILLFRGALFDYRVVDLKVPNEKFNFAKFKKNLYSGFRATLNLWFFSGTSYSAVQNFF